jgi:hypothetical protein
MTPGYEIAGVDSQMAERIDAAIRAAEDAARAAERARCVNISCGGFAARGRPRTTPSWRLLTEGDSAVTKTDKKTIEQVKKLVVLIVEKKEAMSRLRDELRHDFDDLTDLLDDLDQAIPSIEDGCRLIDNGLDTISQRI